MNHIFTITTLMKKKSRIFSENLLFENLVAMTRSLQLAKHKQAAICG